MELFIGFLKEAWNKSFLKSLNDKELYDLYQLSNKKQCVMIHNRKYNIKYYNSKYYIFKINIDDDNLLLKSINEKKGEKTYSIKIKTNRYIANKDIMFNGKCEITLYHSLNLKTAYETLLAMFEEYAECYVHNWGVAVTTKFNIDIQAYKTNNDKTRMFYYNSRFFYIEEE